MSRPASAGTKLTVAGIMPLYNKLETVIEAIDSMMNQTRPLDEILVVDDGSTDGSGDLVAQRYVGESRLRLLRQPNRGVSAARNTAIRATRCDLVAFLDADDRWLPKRIEMQAALMEQQPDCMLILSAAIYCNETLNITRVEGDRIDKRTYLYKTFFPERALPACSGVMVRREALDEVGLFDESLWMGEDTDLWLRIMIRFGFEHIPEPLVWMRRGRPETLKGMERAFVGNDRYFAKHRYTFGRGPRGQAVWRAGYGSVLRGHAIWYFRHGLGRQAISKLMRAICTWPLFNPVWVVKYGLEFILGAQRYAGAVALVQRMTGRGRREQPSG